MKRSSSLLALGALALLSPHVSRAQSTSQNSEQVHTRPRTVQASAAPKTTTAPAASPATTSGTTNAKPSSATPAATSVVVPSFNPSMQPVSVVPIQPARPLSLSKARKSVEEAERLLRSRSTATASTPNISWVTLAALDQESSQVHLLTLPKETLLKKGAEVVMPTSAGLQVRLQIIRPNYVNTAVRISDLQGRQLTPLVVEYPIEKFGKFREMAYYTSVHPALMTPELVKNGQSYVHTMLNLAHKRLKEKGKIISPEIVDIAERLALVEHVDHQRFRTESRADIYNEVYALFALNESNTYRFSVSSAGAGGMVQMIPSTYQMLRRLHPSVGLHPDFVTGMRNHANALEAMLLHMQDNWNDLALRDDVLEALRQNWATQTDLVAAGYNSNSAKLPGYIRRGGSAWRTLIPRETQMYLQIYKSVESLMPFKNRADEKEVKAGAQK